MRASESSRRRVSRIDRARARTKSFARLRVDATSFTASKKYRRNKDFLHARDVCAMKRRAKFFVCALEIFSCARSQDASARIEIFFHRHRFLDAAKR
jgi:hypothetical protein